MFNFISSPFHPSQLTDLLIGLLQMDAKEKELKEKLDLDKDRKDRTFEEMVQEANELRALFT